MYTFSSSLSEAGETSECRLSSGLLGGAKPAGVLTPSFTSEWRLARVSAIGTSRRESVEPWGTWAAARDANFLRHTEHRQSS